MALVQLTFQADPDKPLSWSEFRARLSEDMQARAEKIVKQAMQSPGEEVEFGTGEETSKHKAQKFVVLKRKASVVRALRAAAKRPRTEQASSSKDGPVELELPIASQEQVEMVPWMVANKANATVHFVDTDLPWCQRKQRSPVRIKNPAGQGNGIESAKSLGMPFCPTCKRMFTVSYNVEIDN